MLSSTVKDHGATNRLHPKNDERITYRVSTKESQRQWAALVDRGANGGIAGRDTRVIEPLEDWIDLSGIDNHTVRNLRLVQAGGVVSSDTVSYTHLTLPTILLV